MAKPILYIAPPSQPCRAVMWLLGAMKATETVEVKMINLLAGEHVAPEYTAKTPYQSVPILELPGGEILTESGAILKYLAATNAATAGDFALPTDPLAAARIDEALLHHGDLARQVTLSVIRPMFGAKSKGAEPAAYPAAISAAKAPLVEALTLLNTILGKHQFICGNKITLADLQVTCELNQAPFLATMMDADTAVGKFPNVAAYVKRMSAVPGHDQALEPFKALLGMLTGGK